MKIIYISFFVYLTALLGSEEEFLSLTQTSHEFQLKEPPISFSYTAVTGKFPIQIAGEDSQPPEIFFIGYFKEDASDRPITFIFPGGPGGSCGPDAICTFGPRRILTPTEGKSLLPPYRLIDNPETLLPWTDLVFVDPVGTGFSTTGDDPNALQKLFSVDGDIACLGNFVRTFIAFFNRWNSPKYLSGTSYGTTRCCGIAEYLTSHDFSIHGIILLGSAIDFATLIHQHNRALPNSLIIPTFAATAWYHGRLWPEKTLQEVVDYATRFSFETYIPVTLQPGRLGQPEWNAFYKEMALLTGLPLETVQRYQGRFDEFLYTREFFGSERKVLGGLDTRYVGELCSSQGESEDPSYRDMQGLYCAFNNYLHNELETDKPFERYVTFSSPSNHFWDYRTYDSIEWPELMQRVRKTLVRNPEMKIFVGSGYYDCRTPFAATEYSFDHLNLPPSYKKNLHFKYYEAGHGFIFDYDSLKKLKNDLLEFFIPTEQAPFRDSF